MITLLALGTALCTGLAALIISEVAHLAGGAMTISRWRSLTAAVVLGVYCLLVPGISGIGARHILPVVGSSLAAAVIGEFCLNNAYRALGARRTALLFATAAPFSVLLGWLFLGEKPSLTDGIGIAVVIAGLLLAIVFTPLHTSTVNRHVESKATALAVLSGLTAGFGQAAGNLMARIALSDGADPVTVMALRALVAAIAFWSLWLLLRPSPRMGPFAPPRPVLLVVIAGALISFTLGNTLLMKALSGGDVGVVTTLASTTPVLLLPLTWWRSGRNPGPGAWSGAILTVAGIACIVLL